MSSSSEQLNEQSASNQQSAHSAEALARTLVWLLRMQAVFTAIAALVLAVWLGRDAALAGVIGGGIGIVLTAVAALRMVVVGSDAEPSQMVMAFYRGMAMKLVLAVVLFAIVAKWFAGFFVPVLIGYMATLVAYWLALWRLRVALVART